METRSVQYTHHYGAMASVWRVHVGVAMISLKWEWGVGRGSLQRGHRDLSCLAVARCGGKHAPRMRFRSREAEDAQAALVLPRLVLVVPRVGEQVARGVP